MEETLEQLQSRHRKEQRDLQSRITQKKKNATKKTRKGVNDECAELERQLKERQEDELRRLTDPNAGQDGGDTEYDGSLEHPPAAVEQHQPNHEINNDLSSKLETTSLSSPQASSQPAPPPQPSDTAPQGGKKRNRQKERLARRAAEVEAVAAAAAAEASTMTDHRLTEASRMQPVFASHNLTETQIAPDGHCLFASFASSLQSAGIPLNPSSAPDSDTTPKVMPYKVVRKVAAGYMEDHRDEFEGFLEEPLGSYVEKIRDTAEWGGQLELTALANAYGVEVRVVQDGRTEVIAPTTEGGEEKERRTVWLAYYRHGFGLGEHYNALRKKDDA
ncbi:hypothetical protein GE09DRAFT_1123042 [Coniochaeta sp. 2T2.1]|nr:hypothetical protein GE09DRAFT_1123042 [Coniochaeta sp. 2T2.1]